MAPIQPAIVVLATFLFTGIHAFPSGSIQRVHPRQSVIGLSSVPNTFTTAAASASVAVTGTTTFAASAITSSPLSASISDTTPASSDVVMNFEKHDLAQ
ncbi:hypothetical protein B0H11DRAFT_2233221 [Mycena galericulata]|nr:hypothetical protein B0H11DRAFT_2233221 [Mycena galericulata]